MSAFTNLLTLSEKMVQFDITSDCAFFSVVIHLQVTMREVLEQEAEMFKIGDCGIIRRASVK